MDGGLRPATVAELAREIGNDLPATDPDGLGRWFRESADSGSLECYLATFDHTIAVMQRADARSARCPRVRPGPGRRRCGVRGGALRPEQHLVDGLSLDQVVKSGRQGFAEGEDTARARGTPIVARRLLTAMRHPARSREIAELAVAHRERGVVVFDIAGADAGNPLTRHLDAFAYLSRENAHFTIHAGEAFDYGLDDLRWFTINAMKSAFSHFDGRLVLIDDVVKPGYAALAR